MKTIIDKVISNLWWGAGFLCAVLFSQSAFAADISSQAETQVGDPGKAPHKEPKTSEREKGEIERLLEDYFSRTTSLEPTIEGLLKFGAGANPVLMDYIQLACDRSFLAAHQADQAEASGSQNLATQWRAEQEAASDSRESLVTLAQELETRQLAGSRFQSMVAKGNAQPTEQRKVIRRAISVRYGPPTGPNRKQENRREIYKPWVTKPPLGLGNPLKNIKASPSSIISPPSSSLPKHEK